MMTALLISVLVSIGPLNTPSSPSCELIRVNPQDFSLKKKSSTLTLALPGVTARLHRCQIHRFFDVVEVDVDKVGSTSSSTERKLYIVDFSLPQARFVFVKSLGLVDSENRSSIEYKIIDRSAEVMELKFSNSEKPIRIRYED